MLSLPGKDKKKNTENQNMKNNNRFLITVNVLGSSGPLRFVVNESDKVSTVIDSSLKLYARGGRLPILGSDFKNFLLYPANAGSDALDSTEKIGATGGRNFVMCKKQRNPQMREARSESSLISRHSGGSGGDGDGGTGRAWKTWLNKSFKILSH